METFNSFLFTLRLNNKITFSGRSLRTCAKDIGISAATLSRLTNNNIPDLITYKKCCKWLNLEMEFFFTTL